MLLNIFCIEKRRKCGALSTHLRLKELPFFILHNCCDDDESDVKERSKNDGNGSGCMAAFIMRCMLLKS